MSINVVENSGSTRTYGQAASEYAGSVRGGVATVARKPRTKRTVTTVATETRPVVEKHQNGEVTFHLHGYPDVTCSEITETYGGRTVTSYQSKKSNEERKLEDSKRVSQVVKALQLLIAEEKKANRV